jgi:hypothetical protein
MYRIHQQIAILDKEIAASRQKLNDLLDVTT